jgi:hypothetical protein
MTHIHTEQRSSESSRGWSLHCTDCGDYLGFEDKPAKYSVYVNGWEGSMRVWHAPDFDTPEEAQAWIASQSEWETSPYVDEVYNY